MNANILGVITTTDGELTLKLFSSRRRLIATVVGSKRYLVRAMRAVWPALPPIAANDCEAP